jgi:hypothetical protein
VVSERLEGLSSPAPYFFLFAPRGRARRGSSVPKNAAPTRPTRSSPPPPRQLRPIGRVHRSLSSGGSRGAGRGRDGRRVHPPPTRQHRMLSEKRTVVGHHHAPRLGLPRPRPQARFNVCQRHQQARRDVEEGGEGEGEGQRGPRRQAAGGRWAGWGRHGRLGVGVHAWVWFGSMKGWSERAAEGRKGGETLAVVGDGREKGSNGCFLVGGASMIIPLFFHPSRLPQTVSGVRTASRPASGQQKKIEFAASTTANRRPWFPPRADSQWLAGPPFRSRQARAPPPPFLPLSGLWQC